MLKKLLGSKTFIVLIITAIISTTTIFVNFTTKAASNIDNFVTRSGDKLYENGKEFKFISFNTPELRSDDPFEQEDTILTVKQMGGRVIRIYPFSVRFPNDSNTNYFILSATGDPKKDFNEDEFKRMDKLLELCNKYGIRVIVPFIDQWSHCGGILEFSKMVNSGNGYYDFFKKDSDVRTYFKKFINYVLNRKNSYTGTIYKDDKAILAWETGNELQGDSHGSSYHPDLDDWTYDISKYIKENDPNHLVIDGKYSRWYISNEALNNPYTDIISNHYYPNDNNERCGYSFAERCRRDKSTISGKKPYLVGEFGFSNTNEYEELFKEVLKSKSDQNDTNCIGALLWSLKGHNENGGYTIRKEYDSGYYAYHWPGLHDNNWYPDNEKEVVNLVFNYAYKAQGMSKPNIETPTKPYLHNIFTPYCINWRGSVGAEYYDIERSNSPNGPWTVIGSNITDEKAPSLDDPLFKDTSASCGTQYYYRVKAKNSSGVSEPSNVIGPVILYREGELGENIAKWKPSYSTSYEPGSSNTSEKAFDGNTGTRWSSAYKDGEAIWVDLQRVEKIRRVILKWEYSYAPWYHIQVSQDGSNWTTVYEKRNNTGWIHNIEFNPVDARYVKMLARNRSSRWGVSLWEFEVYTR